MAVVALVFCVGAALAAPGSTRVKREEDVAELVNPVAAEVSPKSERKKSKCQK